MRASHFVPITLVFLVSCGGTDPTVCDQAVQHVAGCLDQNVDTPTSTVCTPEAAAQARNALQMSCSQLAAGERSTTFAADQLICNFLPFICQIVDGVSGGGSGQIRRINDCWNSPQHGFCVDVVKMGNGCTRLMDPHEWEAGQNPWTHAECREMRQGRCRMARVCFNNISDPGQCNHMQHHGDQPMVCSENQHGEGDGDLHRISDCWHDPHHGWCFDAIKLESQGGFFPAGECSRLMPHHEWNPAHHGYSHAECREDHGGECRVVRICRHDFNHKSQCLGQTHHHHDVPMCQGAHP